jgi:hypothetical protein
LGYFISKLIYLVTLPEMEQLQNVSGKLCKVPKMNRFDVTISSTSRSTGVYFLELRQ